MEAPSLSLFDHVNVPVAVIASDGRIVRPNRTWLTALGRSEAELAGRLFWDVVGEAPDRERLRRAFATDTVVDLSFETTDTSWSFRRMEANESGTLYVATGADRTAANRVREALAWSDLLIAASEDAIVSSTPAGTIRSWNPAAERIFGYTAAEAIGQPASIIYPEGNTEDRANVIARMKQGEIVTEHDSPRRRKDGTVFPVAMTGALIRGAGGEILGILGIGRDITGAKRAREAQAWLGNIVNSSIDAIVGTDLDGNIRSWNPAAEQLYGYRTDEIIGRSGDLFYPPERADERSQLLTALRDGRTVTLETVRRRRNGTLVPVLLTAAPVRDDRGAVVGASAIVRDLTERTQAQPELVEHRRALRALATPVIRLWERVLLLPLIGDLDETRSEHIMDTLLQRVIDENAKVVIIDVAGVPTMGTSVADTLLKATRALRMLGAVTVLTGIGPQTSRAMVRLGVDLSIIVTQTSLADGVAVALAHVGKAVTEQRA